MLVHVLMPSVEGHLACSHKHALQDGAVPESIFEILQKKGSQLLANRCAQRMTDIDAYRLTGVSGRVRKQMGRCRVGGPPSANRTNKRGRARRILKRRLKESGRIAACQKLCSQAASTHSVTTHPDATSSSCCVVTRLGEGYP